MAESDANQVYSALNEVLRHWRVSAVPGVVCTDVQRLERLIESDALRNLWSAVSQTESDLATEVVTKALLQKLFEAAEGIPQWDAKTATERKRILSRIDAAATKLTNLLEDAPVRFFSDDALARMDLAVPAHDAALGSRRVGDPDFSIALSDLRKQVAARLGDEPILRRKSAEDTHRAYFVIFVTRYLQWMFDIRDNAIVAELARIMLRDEEIDTETVRKTLS